MTKKRFFALQELSNRKPLEETAPSNKLSDYYGSHVFDRKKVQEYLPKEAYKAVIDAIEKGTPINREIADLIANGMNIKLTDAAYDKIVAEGTDLTNGARPLRRAIQKLIEDPLSEELLAGEWGSGATVLCDVAAGKFVFRHGTGEIPAPRPAGTLGGDTVPAAPRTGNAAPVSGGVTSGPGGMMQAGSGAL